MAAIKLPKDIANCTAVCVEWFANVGNFSTPQITEEKIIPANCKVEKWGISFLYFMKSMIIY